MFIYDVCIFLYEYRIFLYDFWAPCPPWVYPNLLPQQYVGPAHEIIMWHHDDCSHVSKLQIENDPKMNPKRSKIGNRYTKLDQKGSIKPILGSKWASDIRNI